MIGFAFGLVAGVAIGITACEIAGRHFYYGSIVGGVIDWVRAWRW